MKKSELYLTSFSKADLCSAPPPNRKQCHCLTFFFLTDHFSVLEGKKQGASVFSALTFCPYPAPVHRHRPYCKDLFSVWREDLTK